MTLENFDFSILDNSGFLEDSVREEIITPILHDLGYSATGQNRIVRSKSLTHPFVYIGTIQRKINIIPDYVLYVNNEPAIVLDAKAPNENINSGANVEQAFSYAIHKEIRAWLYGLCNGRKLTIFSISDYEPIADIDLVNIKDNWNEIERFLKPEYYERPYLADFYPDLGMTMMKLNESTDIDYIFMNIWVSGIIKIADNEYTINSALKYGENDFMASFDFNKDKYEELLGLIPQEYKEAIEFSLARQPYLANFKQDHQIEIGVVANLTGEIIISEMNNESFVPFGVKEFNRIEN
jgi:hypothetical protein